MQQLEHISILPHQNTDTEITQALRKFEVPECFDAVLVAGRMFTVSKLVSALKTDDIVESWMKKAAFEPGKVNGVSAEDFGWSAEARSFREAMDFFRAAYF